MGSRTTTGGAPRNRPRRPDRRGPGAARRTAALRAGLGNKAGGGQDIGNQACKRPDRIREGTQQDEAKEAGDNEATGEGEDKPKLDLKDGGNTKATKEGEDTPEPDQGERGNTKAQEAGLGGNKEGGARRKTEAPGAGLGGAEQGGAAGGDTRRNNGNIRDKDKPAGRGSNKNKGKEGDRGYKGPVHTEERENPNKTKAKHQAENGARTKHDDSPRGTLNKNLHQMEDRNHTGRNVEKHQAKRGAMTDPNHAGEETRAKHREDDGKGESKVHDTKGDDDRRYYLLVDPRPGEAPDNDYSTTVQSTGTGRSTAHSRDVTDNTPHSQHQKTEDGKRNLQGQDHNNHHNGNS